MRILFLSYWYPYPFDNGSKIRIYNLLRGLSEYHSVDLISFSDNPGEENREALANICNVVSVVKKVHVKPHKFISAMRLLHPIPRGYLEVFSELMRDHIIQATSNCHYDVIIASQIDMALYQKYCPASIPTVLEEVENANIRDQIGTYMGVESFLRRLTWNKRCALVRSLTNRFSVSTVVSDNEKKILESITQNRPIFVIPNGADLSYLSFSNRIPEDGSIIFTGSLSYQPNFDGISKFLRDIWPLIQKANPKSKLRITGKILDGQLESLPFCKNVEFLGYVPDIRPFIINSSISIVPLFSGGGTRLKILESMALGTPVVSMTKGAEGLEFHHGIHLLIADEPEEFASAVLRLLSDANLRQSIRINARRLVEQKYDWKAISKDFVQITESLNSCSNSMQ